jgi:hypothetical protein
MKITFVKAGGFNLSGGDRAIAMYAKHLKVRGHEVLVIATPPDHPSLFDQLIPRPHQRLLEFAYSFDIAAT